MNIHPQLDYELVNGTKKKCNYSVGCNILVYIGLLSFNVLIFPKLMFGDQKKEEIYIATMMTFMFISRILATCVLIKNRRIHEDNLNNPVTYEQILNVRITMSIMLIDFVYVFILFMYTCFIYTTLIFLTYHALYLIAISILVATNREIFKY